jgi:NAD(P)-dependent dehydrogenase (short-subunit alcohol dehydrogenase family)
MSAPAVLITGAASGIGAATADELRQRGAKVVGLDLNATEDWILACDVRDQEQVDGAVAAAIERLGDRLDALINNAGVGVPQSAGAAPDERALALIDVNMIGPWRVTAAALPALRAARGRVVNVASGLAHLTVPFATAYTMSKRGLVGYSDALRLEYGDEISVTTVYPGYIRTPIHDSYSADGLALEGLVPAESVRAAARTLARAALGRPVRDLATTRRLGVGYALLRGAPRGVVDRVTRRVLRRHVRAGRFDRSALAADFSARLGARPAGRS